MAKFFFLLFVLAVILLGAFAVPVPSDNALSSNDVSSSYASPQSDDYYGDDDDEEDGYCGDDYVYEGDDMESDTSEASSPS